MSGATRDVNPPPSFNLTCLRVPSHSAILIATTARFVTFQRYSYDLAVSDTLLRSGTPLRIVRRSRSFETFFRRLVSRFGGMIAWCNKGVHDIVYDVRIVTKRLLHRKHVMKLSLQRRTLQSVTAVYDAGAILLQCWSVTDRAVTPPKWAKLRIGVCVMATEESDSTKMGSESTTPTPQPCQHSVAKYCSAQVLDLSDLSRRLRTAVLCSALNRAKYACAGAAASIQEEDVIVRRWGAPDRTAPGVLVLLKIAMYRTYWQQHFVSVLGLIPHRTDELRTKKKKSIIFRLLYVTVNSNDTDVVIYESNLFQPIPTCGHVFRALGPHQHRAGIGWLYGVGLEEEEEQVPTDGGTSAEAMQVPYEEGEMEEDETINDENYLSKRPLDSPEAEMPFPKRQRLANSKGDILDGTLEPREPLSSINTQKVSPMLSPTHLPDNSDLTISSSEPVMLSPILKPQTPSKPLESKALTSKTKSKSSPGQKTKSPKSTALGSPMRSPKNTLKDKKSPGRAKSPKSPKSPKTSAPASQPTVKSETPSRTPLAALSEKIGRENIQVKPSQASQDSEKVNPENPSKKPSVTDNTIEDSIDAVVARACAEQEPDPFEFSSGSESEGDVFTSPKRLTIAEPGTPKVSAANSSLGKMCSTPLPASGGTSSSDISWTMDDSINEVIRKVNQETPQSVSISQPCFSSPSASPPTPEPLVKTFEDKAKLASPVELKKKAKKELKTKTKKKDKEKQKDKDKSKEKNKDKNKEKDKDSNKDSKLQWKDSIKDDDGELPRLKSKDLNDSEQKPKQKESSGKKEKHKDKKKDKEKGRKDKEKKEKGKDKNKEEKLKNAQPTPVVLPSKDLSLAILSTPNAVRLPSLMPSIAPLVSEKVTEDREKTKEKDKKKEKKEKKKKKDKEKVKEKEKEKKEKEKKDKDKEKHKHDKQAKVELSIPAPSPVIPRLTLRVGAGQDTM
ncbi:unnamed protein product [Ranitomeya imitator]|uniref:Uncharacterized protein n=1 Tax=Ranitomeya imitator TaxID=111125 RepID=A0ABN9KXQ0_9NEOB|nr:unnamed protein product [Ranitomeya imitator]